MARQAAVQAAGFYPMANEVAELIALKLTAPKDSRVTVLDPCAGEGRALKTIVDHLRDKSEAKVIPYAVELNSERFKTMVELFGTTHGMACGATEFLEMTSQSISVLVLNPPFDNNGNEQERWLRTTLPFLAPGGVLLFVTTENSIGNYSTQDILSKQYKSVGVFKFPQEHRPYKEVLYVGYKRMETYRGWLPAEERIKANVRDMREMADLPAVAVSIEVDPPRIFGVTVPNLSAVVQTIGTSGVSTTRAWQDLTRPQALSNRFRPLRKLGDGHIANMIASGAFRGLALQDLNKGRCLISGYGGRINTPPETETLPDGSKRIITKQTPVIHLNVFDIDRNKLVEYSSQEPESLQHFILSNLALLRDSIHNNFPELFEPETMLQPYLEAASYFASPGLLPGASRARLKDGTKVRLIRKLVDSWEVDDNGNTREVKIDDVQHIYYKMLPAQIIEASSLAWLMENKSKGGLEIGQMGVGKTSTGAMAMFLARLHKYGLMINKDIKGKMTVVGNDGLPAKESKLRNTIVIMAPGHLVGKWDGEKLSGKWSSEIRDCFKGFEFPDGPIKIVSPGKSLRRVNNYDIVDRRSVSCKKCGKRQVVLSSKDSKAGITAEQLMSKTKRRVECAGCGGYLVDFRSTPIQDIDEAFQFHGLSVIILPKDKSKLGADWRGIGGDVGKKNYDLGFTLHRIGTKTQGVVTTEDRIRCPKCGNFATYYDTDAESEEFLTPEMLQAAKKNRTKYYCRAVVERSARGEDGEVITEKHYSFPQDGYFPVTKDVDKMLYPYVDQKEIPSTVVDRLPEIDRLRLKQYSRPIMSTRNKRIGADHRCGEPLFLFSALGGGEGKQRVELTHYIARHYRRQYDFIGDEIHQYKGLSTQGAAAQVLISNANYSLGLTGTPYGGKASSVFYMLHRLIPGFREVYDHSDIKAFVDRYGVRDTITTVSKDGENDVSAYGAINRGKKNSTRTQEGNGVLPNIIEMFLPWSAFITLNGLHITLPPKSEHFHWLPLDNEMKAEAAKLHSVRKLAAQKSRMGAPSMLSVWMNAELFWSLAPNHDVTYITPDNRRDVEALRKSGKNDEADKFERAATTTWANAIKFTDAYPETSMTRQVADACLKDWNNGENRSIVYVASQKFYGAEHIYQACKKRGLRPFILTTSQDDNVAKFAAKGTYAKSDLEDRMEEVWDAVENGFNILICNPAIVAEGVDLVDFSRLHVLGLPNYSVYKFAQALARLHRPGQERPVEINFWAYGENPTVKRGDNQLQALAVATMSTKMRAANVVTGEVGSSLAALNDNAGNILSEIRNQIMQDKIPTFDGLTNTATFSGKTDPMTPLEIAIRDIIEKFEDARLYGEPLPSLDLPIERKPVFAIAEAEPTPDDILAELEMNLDLDMPVGLPEPEHEEEVEAAKVPDFIVDVDKLKEDAYQKGCEATRSYDNLPKADKFWKVNNAWDVFWKPFDDTATPELREAVAEEFWQGAAYIENKLAGVVQTIEPEQDIVKSITSDSEPEAVTEDRAPETISNPVSSDDGFGIEEIQPEEAPEIDVFGVIVTLSDDFVDWRETFVYDDTEFSARTLPGAQLQAVEF